MGKHRNSSRLGARRNGIFMLVILVLGIGVGLWRGGGHQSAVTSAAGGQPELTVTYFHVGQADCTLLESGGQTLLLGGGSRTDGAAVTAYLARRGTESLTYVAASYPRADHIGGLITVAEEYPVETFLLTAASSEEGVYSDFLTAVELNGGRVELPEAGDTVPFGSCTVEVLGPIGEQEDTRVLRVVCGETAFLFAGDMTADGEGALLAWAAEAGATLSADVLKVGNYGSADSTSGEFLAAADPAWAVISCGGGDTQNCPDQSVLERLSTQNITICRTDTMGTITAHSDGQTVTLAPEDESYGEEHT